MLQQNQTIKSWAEDDRPREKLILKGKSNLSDSELIAILLRTGAKNKSALDLAKEVLFASDNSLLHFSQQTIKDLCKIKGIGKAKAVTLIAALELSSRKDEKRIDKKVKINTSNLAYNLLRNKLEHLKHEEFYVLYLNRANNLILSKRLSMGGLTGTIVDNRMIFKEAIDLLACGIILAHNHPSGQLKPSSEDLHLTKKLIEIGKMMDILVLDHLIICQNNFFSFADNGLI